MQRNTSIGIAIVLVVIAAIIAYFALRPVPVKAPGTSAVVAIVLPAEGYSEHTQYYDITANYATSTPLLASAGPMQDATARSLMYGFIRDTIASFKTDGGFDRLTPEDIQVMDGRKEDLEIVYLIATSARTVSYVFTVYKDTLGAHGNTTFKTFTFDTKTGAALALSDVFMLGASYLDKLTSISRSRLPEVIGDGFDINFVKDGTTPEDKNFANFFFDSRDFVVLFAPYAVAPYSSGPQTLRIPIELIRSILKPEYR